ncbi:hypothetical protein H1S01_00935 [Heliobacterium chlorum]|uniref:YcdB/YcdC repeated domain-containing protein n=1 Tax=Heliobacterium chlorum TaxID=2698 RepID=A0ABR7SZL8_HELCL|nr:YcdB/YcdC domain-containing protein [Heliobacterium chlorum]MBC9783069.1 hypothetical protein [Heliobacterium chlorum]
MNCPNTPVKKMAALTMTLTMALLLGQPIWIPESSIRTAEASLPENKGETVAQADAGETSEPSSEVIARADELLQALIESNPALGRLKLQGKSKEFVEGTATQALYSGCTSTWNITLGSENADEWAQLTVDGQSGDAIRFCWNNYVASKEKNLTEERAREVASSFLKSVAGEQFSVYRIKEESLIENGEFAFQRTVRFERLINGIPLLNCGWYVVVDAYGRINDARLEGPHNFSDASFPKPTGLLPVEEIKAKVDKWLPFQLSYRPMTSDDSKQGPPKAGLVYTPVVTGIVLADAVTGEAPPSQKSEIEVFRFKGDDRNIIGNEAEAVQWLKRTWGVDVQTMEQIRVPMPGHEPAEVLYRCRVPFKGGVAVQSGTTDSGNGSEQGWVREYNIAVEATTGKFIRYSVIQSGEDIPQLSLPEDQVKEKARRCLENMLGSGEYDVEMEMLDRTVHIPEWVDRSRFLKGEFIPDGLYNFHFRFRHYGIPDGEIGASCLVDSNTGDINLEQLKYPQMRDYPDPSKAVSVDRVKAAYLKKWTPRLVYKWPDFYGQGAPKANLYYTISDEMVGVTYDALTGEETSLYAPSSSGTIMFDWIR